jgi:violaxanthin de-epoxidase
VAAQKVNMDFDKDFTLTDNSCPTEQGVEEKLLLREKFAGKVLVQTEQQAQAAATRLRGNAANGAKAQKLFMENEIEVANKAFAELQAKTKEFEEEVVKDAVRLEEEVVKDAVKLEQAVVGGSESQ